MSIKVLQSGNTVSLINADKISDDLFVGNFDLCYHPERGYFLTVKNDFSLPAKIYGDPFTFTARVLKTWEYMQTKKRGMGVLLSGKKGTGKSITAKVIAIKSNRPVISVSSAHRGESFTAFVNSISVPSVFLIDEVEKVYDDEESRNYLLSLLDGISSTNHLFILTSNEDYIGEYFVSRPGRIRYHKIYDTLDQSIITAIIDDKVSDPVLNAAIKDTVSRFYDMSPDALISLIEESLLYNEPPDNFMEFFNVRNESHTSFQAMLYRKGWSIDYDAVGHDEDRIDALDLVCKRLNAVEVFTIEEAKKYIKEVTLLRYVKVVDKIYASSFANPFDNDSVERINVSYMHSIDRSDRDSYVHVNWHKDDCVVTRSPKGIEVSHYKGYKLVLTVSKRKTIDAF